MFCECYRVLRMGGTIRVSTPNLASLIDLYKPNKSPLQKRYVQEMTDHWIRPAPYYDEVFVINYFFRDWGHQFIYDDRTLSRSLEEAGFAKISRPKCNTSREEALRNLENEARYPKGLFWLETFALEAKK